MKNKIFSIVCALLMTITTSAATTLPIKGTIISPTNPNICYVGRISFKNPERPMFNWPGIQIIARFEGTSLRMIAKPKSFSRIFDKMRDCDTEKLVNLVAMSQTFIPYI